MRTESVKIELGLNKSQVNVHLENIKIISKDEPQTVEGDTLNLIYHFYIEYFADVAERLQAIINILEDKKIIRNINIEELNYSRSIIIQLIQKIDQVKAQHANNLYDETEKQRGNKSS